MRKSGILEIYEGFFKHHMLNGFGRKYNENGKILEEGIYKDHRLVKK